MELFIWKSPVLVVFIILSNLIHVILWIVPLQHLHLNVRLNNDKVKYFFIFFAGLPGFEPEMLESKSSVIPISPQAICTGDWIRTNKVIMTTVLETAYLTNGCSDICVESRTWTYSHLVNSQTLYQIELSRHSGKGWIWTTNA